MFPYIIQFLYVLIYAQVYIRMHASTGMCPTYTLKVTNLETDVTASICNTIHTHTHTHIYIYMHIRTTGMCPTSTLKVTNLETDVTASICREKFSYFWGFKSLIFRKENLDDATTHKGAQPRPMAIVFFEDVITASECMGKTHNQVCST